jgi:hypothetical protein
MSPVLNVEVVKSRDYISEEQGGVGKWWGEGGMGDESTEFYKREI